MPRISAKKRALSRKEEEVFLPWFLNKAVRLRINKLLPRSHRFRMRGTSSVTAASLAIANVQSTAPTACASAAQKPSGNASRPPTLGCAASSSAKTMGPRESSCGG